MASHSSVLGREPPPLQEIAKRWTDNREPELVEMLEDSAIQAIMTRDGVMRQDIAALLAHLRADGRASTIGSGASSSVDPPVAICYSCLAAASGHPSSEPAMQRGSSAGLSIEGATIIV